MFGKIKDLIKRKKNKSKNEYDILNLESNKRDFIDNAQIQNEKQDYTNDSSCDLKLPSNVVDLNKYRKEKIDIKLDITKLDIKNNKSIKRFLENKDCFECKTSLSSISKISSISDLGDYKYICCSNCGCIMKLDYNCNLTNSKNILKEVSDAYVLFKKVDMEPESYSYTRNGERHNF